MYFAQISKGITVQHVGSAFGMKTTVVYNKICTVAYDFANKNTQKC